MQWLHFHSQTLLHNLVKYHSLMNLLFWRFWYMFKILWRCIPTQGDRNTWAIDVANSTKKDHQRIAQNNSGPQVDSRIYQFYKSSFPGQHKFDNLGSAADHSTQSAKSNRSRQQVRKNQPFIGSTRSSRQSTWDRRTQFNVPLSNVTNASQQWKRWRNTKSTCQKSNHQMEFTNSTARSAMSTATMIQNIWFTS